MRLHALGIPPTITSKDYSCCAFTNQLRLFCKFMTESGHDVVHYGNEYSEAECSEHVSVLFDKDMKHSYGVQYREKQRFFKHNSNDEVHKKFYKRTFEELQKRKTELDIVLCFWGMGHYELASKLNSDWMVVEPSVSYAQSFAKNRVFASYSIMNVHYAQNKQDPSFWDTVIPHYLDPAEFEYNDKKDDYILFLGRVIPSKGVGLIFDLAKKINKKFLIAGHGDVSTFYKVSEIPKNVEILGVVNSEQRKNLLKNAKLLIVPTFYNEPFGLVVAEALMSGTPAITTDWGGFVENNRHGLTGFRCRTFGQFINAIENVDNINSKNCRKYALNNFSIDYAKNRYIDYFEIIKQRKERGFYCQKNKANSVYEFLI
jgi:glycosyltransferase involved in cell wall biosynthesis